MENGESDETADPPQDGRGDDGDGGEADTSTDMLSMIEQAEDCLAQSLLVFLFADLRLLSATGRIRTNFENFVLASDEFAKLGASKLTGSPDDLDQLSSTSANKGVSPAHIMASLMIETRKEIVECRKNSAEAETSMFSTLLEANGRKDYEDGMHALFRANYEMIGRDLKADIPAFKQKDFPTFERKGIDMARFPQAANLPDIKEELDHTVDKVKERYRRVSFKTMISRKPQSQEMTNDPPSTSAEDGRRIGTRGSNNRGSGGARSSLHRSTSRRASFPDAVAGRGLDMDTIEDVGDAFFNMSVIPEESNQSSDFAHADSNTTVPEDVLLNTMEEAVESRDDGKLDFMASFFKDRSVSQLVILSQARIVWMNDWYPLKDCTYAISVDAGKKEVLVVFRGAITRADWGHAKDLARKQVPNPVEDQFEGRTSTIDVHQGFYRYLFRQRKDNGTTKYQEIANVLHHFGSQLGEYKVVVTGHSLGGALTILFSLWASCDERFVRNGPIQMYTFGNPLVAGKSFVNTFRHQERAKKLHLARFYNERDSISFLPISFKGGYQHVGLSIEMPYRRHALKCFQKQHKLYYANETTFCGFYFRSLRNNYFFNMPWPWRIRKVHSLAELQKRLIRVRKKIQEYDETHGTNEINSTLEQLYARHHVYD